MVNGGKEYSSAIWVVPPVVMSIIFNMLYNLVSNYAFYFEKTKFVMIGTVIVAIVNVILNIIFIQMFGFVAAGYTTLFCYIIYSAIHYCFMMRICKKNNIVTPFNTIKMWGVAFGALTITLMLSSLYNSFIARYIIIMCVLLLIMLNKKKIVRIFRNIV